MSRRKKTNKLEEYANDAVAAGLTYGKAQQKEYLKQIKIGPVPKGYKKAGDKSNM